MIFILSIIGFVACLVVYVALFLVALIPNTMFFASNPGVPIHVTLYVSFKNALKCKSWVDVMFLVFITFTSIPLIVVQLVGSPFTSKD